MSEDPLHVLVRKSERIVADSQGVRIEVSLPSAASPRVQPPGPPIGGPVPPFRAQMVYDDPPADLDTVTDEQRQSQLDASVRSGRPIIFHLIAGDD